jgi:predicted transglutaminase-like cysteine proteinase
MYDSNYPSNKKRSSNIDDTTYLPTAERSPYHESFLNRTPNRSQPSSIPNPNDRLSETRRSIDEIIQQVSAKKSLNQEAIEEVRNVNQEIATSLHNYNPVRSSHQEQRNRTAEHHRADSRDIVVTSQFEWRPQGSEEDLKRSQQESVISQ